MKFCYISIALIAIFISQIYPQGMTKGGSISISGTALFSYTSYAETGDKGIYSIQPSVSYFIFNNFEAGINAQVTFSHETKIYLIQYDYYYYGKHAVAYDAHMYGAGPFLAYYFGSGEVKPFISASYTYNKFVFGDSYYVNNDNAYVTNTANFSIGCLIPAGEKIALTPLIQYQILSYVHAVYQRDPLFGSKEAPNEQTLSIGAQFKIFL